MKTMTCKQLAGACDKQFHAETFEEMAAMSKKHGTQMFEKGDEQHLERASREPGAHGFSTSGHGMPPVRLQHTNLCHN